VLQKSRTEILRDNILFLRVTKF